MSARHRKTNSARCHLYTEYLNKCHGNIEQILVSGVWKSEEEQGKEMLAMLVGGYVPVGKRSKF